MQQKPTQSKLTPQELAQGDKEQEQKKIKMSQPIKIIITPPSVEKPTAAERRKTRPDTSRLLVPLRKKPTKRTRGKKKRMNNRQHQKNAHRNDTKENSHNNN